MELSCIGMKIRDECGAFSSVMKFPVPPASLELDCTVLVDLPELGWWEAAVDGEVFAEISCIGVFIRDEWRAFSWEKRFPVSWGVPVVLDCVELVDLIPEAGCWQLVVEIEFLGPVLVGSFAINCCKLLYIAGEISAWEKCTKINLNNLSTITFKIYGTHRFQFYLWIFQYQKWRVWLPSWKLIKGLFIWARFAGLARFNEAPGFILISY